MICKAGVTRAGVQPPIWYACGVAEMVYRKNGFVMTVTSMTDSHEDRTLSLHNKGLAVDFRTKNVPREFLTQLWNELKSFLNPLGFDVILENDHIHCEYDPKDKENWISIQ